MKIGDFLNLGADINAVVVLHDIDSGAEIVVSLYGYFSGEETVPREVLNADIATWDFISVGGGLCLNYQGGAE